MLEQGGGASYISSQRLARLEIPLGLAERWPRDFKHYVEALRQNVLSLFQQIVAASPNLSDDLVTNAYRLNYLRDAQAAPDGGFPNKTTGVPPANPTNTLRQDLKTNDLRNWSPTAPVLLCGGNADPSVFYLNTRLMQDFWAMNAPSSQLTVLDVDSPASSGDPYANLKNEFVAAKAAIAAAAVAGGATDGGAAAVLQVYHAGLVPPFCIVAVTSFFDNH